MVQKLLLIFVLQILVSSFAFSGIRLPIHSLRDQSSTAHCWAYASSHLLETRTLDRESMDVIINIEKDVKYWVDYERMLYNFQTKKDFYMGSYEGGWQIEYWESFLKHGKSIYQVKINPPQILYPLFDLYSKNLGFIDSPRPTPDPTLISLEAVAEKLKGNDFKSESEVISFARDYLDRLYGKNSETTDWFDHEIKTEETSKYILGKDYGANHETDSLVLVKPVTDGKFGWVRYLQDRYWGYRYDQTKILKLIEYSLDQHWPVTFDNVYHAMTLIGYEKKGGDIYYAVVDSAPGSIYWKASKDMLTQLNLVTFFKEAIQGQIPPRAGESVLRFPLGFMLDHYDHVDFPPR